MANKKISENMIVVNESELAEYIGVSVRRIRQMVKEGTAEKVGANQFDLKTSVQRYVNFLKEKNKTKDENLEKIKISKEAEVLMHERLKKRKTELQVLQLEKKMHASEDVEYFWNQMIFAAKSKITALPTKVAPVLVGIEDVKEVQSILKREVGETLNELANYNIDDFESEFDDVFEDED